MRNFTLTARAFLLYAGYNMFTNLILRADKNRHRKVYSCGGFNTPMLAS